MYTRTVSCSRCGIVLTDERPLRLTLHTPEVEVTTDFKGEQHMHKVYRTSQTLHLCRNCKLLFDSFMMR